MTFGLNGKLAKIPIVLLGIWENEKLYNIQHFEQ